SHLKRNLTPGDANNEIAKLEEVAVPPKKEPHSRTVGDTGDPQNIVAVPPKKEPHSRGIFCNNLITSQLWRKKVAKNAKLST
ncbi:MAG: hypothetical protein L6Q97_22285, partial [Thermoanaerobaculia bacterium]|nr:hypothetical protein [Thermoanaerobaculia bacterium]